MRIRFSSHDIGRMHRQGQLEGETEIAVLMSLARKFGATTHDQAFARARGFRRQLDEKGEIEILDPEDLPDLSEWGPADATPQQAAAAFLAETIDGWEDLPAATREKKIAELLQQIAQAEGDLPTESDDDEADEPQLAARAQAIKNLCARDPEGFGRLDFESQFRHERTLKEERRVRLVRAQREEQRAGARALRDERPVTTLSEQAATQVATEVTLEALAAFPGRNEIERCRALLRERSPQFGRFDDFEQLRRAADVVRALRSRSSEPVRLSDAN